jgi:hypothetical protein
MEALRRPQPVTRVSRVTAQATDCGHQATGMQLPQSSRPVRVTQAADGYQCGAAGARGVARISAKARGRGAITRLVANATAALLPRNVNLWVVVRLPMARCAVKPAEGLHPPRVRPLRAPLRSAEECQPFGCDFCTQANQ